MKIISVVNPKGGSGKTVSAVNIAYALKNRNKKVLLIDTDPRGAIAIYLNLKNSNTIFELIKENYENLGIVNNFNKYITEKNGIDVIVSNSDMIKIDDFFRNEGDLEGQFKIFVNLKEQLKNYDFVIIDTEGTINNTIRGVLNATDYIFAPTKISYIDTTGLRDLIKMYEIGKRNNPKIRFEKLFSVQVENNTKVFKKAQIGLSESFKTIKEYLGQNPYTEIYIRKSADILNSMEENIDIFTYKKSSGAAIDYKNLIDEFLKGIQ